MSCSCIASSEDSSEKSSLSYISLNVNTNVKLDSDLCSLEYRNGEIIKSENVMGPIFSGAPGGLSDNSDSVQQKFYLNLDAEQINEPYWIRFESEKNVGDIRVVLPEMSISAKSKSKKTTP